MFSHLASHFRLLSVAAPISCFFAAAALFLSCSQALARSGAGADSAAEKGVASYYSGSYSGRHTASGARYNPQNLTAAHPWLPFGTRLRVTAENGHTIDVIITDRMTAAHRIIDLSYQAARRLGIVREGVAYVSLAPM